MDNATLGQLKDATKQALEQGHSHNEVKAFMKKSGYSDEEINLVLGNAPAPTHQNISKAEMPQPKSSSGNISNPKIIVLIVAVVICVVLSLSYVFYFGAPPANDSLSTTSENPVSESGIYYDPSKLPSPSYNGFSIVSPISWSCHGGTFSMAVSNWDSSISDLTIDGGSCKDVDAPERKSTICEIPNAEGCVGEAQGSRYEVMVVLRYVRSGEEHISEGKVWGSVEYDPLKDSAPAKSIYVPALVGNPGSEGFSGVFPKEWSCEGNSLSLEIANGAGGAIDDIGILGGSCDESSVPVGGIAHCKVAADCSNGNYIADVIITYTDPMGLKKASQGVVWDGYPKVNSSVESVPAEVASNEPTELKIEKYDIVVDSLVILEGTVMMQLEINYAKGVEDHPEWTEGDYNVYGCTLTIDGREIIPESPLDSSLPNVFIAQDSDQYLIPLPAEVDTTIDRDGVAKLCCSIYHVGDTVKAVSDEFCQWGSFEWMPEDWLSGPHVENWVDTPITYCGDGTCQNDENCSTCSADCGQCPRPQNYQDYPVGEDVGPKHRVVKEVGYGDLSETDADICRDGDRPIVYFFGREYKTTGSLDSYSRSVEDVVDSLEEEYSGLVTFYRYPHMDTNTPISDGLRDFAGRYDVNYYPQYGNLGAPILIVSCKYANVGAFQTPYIKDVLSRLLYDLVDPKNRPKGSTFTLELTITNQKFVKKEISILDKEGNVIASKTGSGSKFTFTGLTKDSTLQLKTYNLETRLTSITYLDTTHIIGDTKVMEMSMT